MKQSPTALVSLSHNARIVDLSQMISLTTLSLNKKSRRFTSALYESLQAEAHLAYAIDNLQQAESEIAKSRTSVVLHKTRGRLLSPVQKREDDNLEGLLIDKKEEPIVSNSPAINPSSIALSRRGAQRVKCWIVLQGFKSSVIGVEQVRSSTRTTENLGDISHRAHHALMGAIRNSNLIVHMQLVSLQETQMHPLFCPAVLPRTPYQGREADLRLTAPRHNRRCA